MNFMGVLGRVPDLLTSRLMVSWYEDWDGLPGLLVYHIYYM